VDSGQTLRDDSRGALRDDTPKRRPDNGPGQDPHAKKGREENRQSLFLLSLSRERDERLVNALSRLFRTFSRPLLLQEDYLMIISK